MSDPDFARFAETVVSVLEVPADSVTAEATFGDDLDADSLDLVELMMAIEEQFDIEIPEEDLEGVATVGQAWELVQSKRA